MCESGVCKCAVCDWMLHEMKTNLPEQKMSIYNFIDIFFEWEVIDDKSVRYYALSFIWRRLAW